MTYLLSRSIHCLIDGRHLGGEGRASAVQICLPHPVLWGAGGNEEMRMVWESEVTTEKENKRIKGAESGTQR